MLEQSDGLLKIVKELQSANLSQDLILDTIDNYSPVLGSKLAEDTLQETNPFYAGVTDLIDKIRTMITESTARRENILANDGPDMLSADVIGEIPEEFTGSIEELQKSVTSIYDRLIDAIKNGDSNVDASRLIEEEVKRLNGILTDGKLQEEENRREMVDVLEDIADNQVSPPPLPPQREQKGGGIFGALLGMFMGGKFLSNMMSGLKVAFGPLGKSLMKLFPTGMGKHLKEMGKLFQGFSKFIPPGIMQMFGRVSAFGGGLAKFGKLLLGLGKLAGPIGLVISVFTGIIGAVQGFMKGFKEGGIVEGLKEGIVGLFNGLIGDLAKMLGNVAEWLLDLIGLGELGKSLSNLVDGLVDGIVGNFRGMWDLIVGIFTGDTSKIVGALTGLFNNSMDNIIKPLLNFVWVALQELVPLILKGLKFLWIDLPLWMAELGLKLIKYLWDEGPTLVSKFISFVMDLGDKIGNEFLPMILEKIVESITGVVKNIQAKFGTNIGDIGENFAKNILRSILPEKDKHTSKEDPLYWISHYAIPSGVYEYAKLPPPVPPRDLEAEAKAGFKGTRTTKLFDTMDPALQKRFLENAEAPAGEEMRLKVNPRDIIATVSNKGNMISAAGASGAATTIVVNQMGGNVTNTSVSTVSNNTTPFEPIITGSGLGMNSL